MATTSNATAPDATRHRSRLVEVRPTAIEELAREATDPIERLMASYIAICNRAIARNKDRFWFEQGKRLNRAIWGGSSFRTVVYDENPDDVLAEFEIMLDPEAEALGLIPPGAQEPSFSWKVPIGYLRDVVDERPDWYLEHPLALDGVWFADRVRDELRTRTDQAAARPALSAASSFALGFAAASALFVLLRGAARRRQRGPIRRAIEPRLEQVREQVPV